MSLIKCQTVLERTSGLPEDRVVMDMFFGTGPADQSLVTIGLIETAMQDFWQQPLTTALTLSSWLATDIKRTAQSAQRRYYGKEPGEADFGSPLLVHPWTPSTASQATGLPDEVAICLSWRGDLTDVAEEVGTTRPAARRRGRMFFGPLTADAVSTGAGLPTRPRQTTVDDLALAATQLLTASNSASEWTWVVAHAAATSAFSTVAVVDGWVDNAWDTQRRRGVAATGRTVFP